MRGIILAGGSGTRLHPVTFAISKQLLPVYNKPMVYYSISVLMLAGIRDILIVSTPRDLPLFKELLGDGAGLGIQFDYAAQETPGGIAQALLIAGPWVGSEDVTLILGDNIFYGHGLPDILQTESKSVSGCTIFGYKVNDPERYGVAELSPQGSVISLTEKPQSPKSRWAVTGLYMYENQAISIVKSLKPSSRGELEITDLNKIYVEANKAKLIQLGRGMAWLDCGTFDSLLEASQYVQILESRQNTQIACLEEIAFRMGFIDESQLVVLGTRLGKSSYGDYVRGLLA